MHAIRQIIKPKDCLMCFGIPVSVEDIETAQFKPERDFYHLFNGKSFYNEAVTDPFDIVHPFYKAYGLRIQFNISLNQFQDAFSFQQNKVIILFSHYNQSSIEFSEGLIPFEQISHIIPKSYQGILDLCVCHPLGWIDSLEKTHPDLIIRYLENQSTPSLWLYFYRYLMKLLYDNDMKYITAFSRATLDHYSKFEKPK